MVQPDCSEGRVWLSELTSWIDKHGLCGYDPFDVKQHPLIRAAQPYTWPRRATTALCDVFPVAMRRLLRVAPTENAKAFALVALGSLRLFEAFGDEVHLERAKRHLEWLRCNVSPGYAGMCWGYPFNVFAKGLDTPRGTPIGVVSAISGEAFALAYSLTRAPEHLSAVRSIAEFFLADIPRMNEIDGAICFGYTPTDRRRVHNANLHAVAHLYRTYGLTGEARFLEPAERGLRFTLKRQRADGSWPYGEWDPAEPFEKGLMDIVDHHHTGFVLRSLHEIFVLTRNEEVHTLIAKGYGYYASDLFAADGMPVTKFARYPVDIHACTEAILCPSVLAAVFPDALELATRSLHWTHGHMRNPRTGAPYYRLYPGFTSHLVCTRWGVAWLFYALCEHAVAIARSEMSLS